MSVAYHGLPGAFSHEACLKFLPAEEAVGLRSFADVVRAVESGEVDYGILPRENNNAGRVDEVQALLKGSSLRVIAEHKLPIRIQLLALPGSSLDQLRTAVSHPMAIKQCVETLRSLGLETETRRARPLPPRRSMILRRPCSPRKPPPRPTGLSF